MKQEQKQKYVAPTIEVIQMENEGVIAASGNGTLDDIGNGGDIFATSADAWHSGGYTSSNDLEDMINDILTVEN